MTTYDTIVIGAGLAGLSAAKLLDESGINVLVLEARDRVGGRTCTIKDPAIDYTDVGGAYIGPTQNRMIRLAKEFGVDNYFVNEKERSLFVPSVNSSPIPFQGNDMAIYNPLVIMDMVNAQRLFDDMGKQVSNYCSKVQEKTASEEEKKVMLGKKMDPKKRQMSIEAPWDCEHAEEWDSMTVKDFMDQHCWFEITRSFVTTVARAAFTTEPENMSLLFFIWYFKCGAGFLRLIGTTDGGQERKVVGGSMQISEKIAEKLGKARVLLGNPVTRLEQNEDGVSVTVADGSVFKASYAICSVPPAIMNKISFQPSLPALKNQLIQRMPMGSCIKTMMYYKKPFWRDLDYNGTVIGLGPIVGSFEDTKPDGSHPGIMEFVNGEMARRYCHLTKEERKQVIAEYYAKVFNTEEALHPIYYVEKNWMEEEWSGGCYMAAPPPGVFSRYGKVLRTPFGRVFFAGTKTATWWSGYMEGAVQSGERAAREVLHAKRILRRDQVWQEEPQSLDMPARPLEYNAFERNCPSVTGFLKFCGVVTSLSVVGGILYLHKDRLPDISDFIKS